MTSSPQDPTVPAPEQRPNVIRLDTLAREGREPDVAPPEDPALRMRQLGRVSSDDQWAYVREKLTPMLLQRMKRVDMALVFNISVDTIYRWCDRLQEELRKEAVNIQPRDFIMESLTSLRVARGEAWSTYYSLTNPKEKARWLTHVLRVEDQWRHLGAAVGMFGGRDDKPLAAKTYGEDGGREPTSGLGLLQDLVKQFLGNPYRTGSKETDTELLGTAPEEPQRAAQLASKDPYAGLFDDMGEYDGEAPPLNLSRQAQRPSYRPALQCGAGSGPKHNVCFFCNAVEPNGLKAVNGEPVTSGWSNRFRWDAASGSCKALLGIMRGQAFYLWRVEWRVSAEICQFIQ